jgi:hypothetical protein
MFVSPIQTRPPRPDVGADQPTLLGLSACRRYAATLLAVLAVGAVAMLLVEVSIPGRTPRVIGVAA